MVRSLKAVRVSRCVAIVCAASFVALLPAACANREQKQPDAESNEAESAAQAPDPYVDFPLYGLVTGAQFSVHKDADPESIVLGWLRRGEVVRLKSAQSKTATCRSGWFPIHPQGYACAGEGIDVSDKAPVIGDEDRVQAKRDTVMPYQYFMVKDTKVPEYW